MNKNYSFKSVSLTKKDFDRLGTYIWENFGIKMPPAKITLLQGRLQKRLRALGMDNFTQYIDYVFSKDGYETELIQMVDLVTTNKTDFFREADHFEFLRERALPDLLSSVPLREPLKVWSAGCSSGEEPYTLSMVLMEYMAHDSRLKDYQMLGTDLSSRILQKAMNAVYPLERVNVVPIELKRKYMLKSKDKDNPTVRMKPELRKKIRWQRLNFMDDAYENINEDFHVIFCRNVLIYFDKDTQEQVVRKLAAFLRPGGYFFSGHSESIGVLDVPLKQIKPTVFIKG